MISRSAHSMWLFRITDERYADGRNKDYLIVENMRMLQFCSLYLNYLLILEVGDVILYMRISLTRVKRESTVVVSCTKSQVHLSVQALQPFVPRSLPNFVYIHVSPGFIVTYTTPLAFVLFVTMEKEACDQYPTT